MFGANGAGKTTTIELLLGLVRPTVGNARVDSIDGQADQAPGCSLSAGASRPL